MTTHVPGKLCRQIARYAVQLAREYGRKRGWKSTETLLPISGSDIIGIDLNGAYWLKFQNRGTHAFIPWSLEGKIIPMRTPRDGRIHYRYAHGVGKPGYVHDPYDEELTYWKEQKWRNPGIEATWFIDESVRQAFRYYHREIEAYNNRRDWMKKDSRIHIPKHNH